MLTTPLTKEQKEGAEAIEAMNRKDRRALGKRLHVKIPGSSVPFERQKATRLRDMYKSLLK